MHRDFIELDLRLAATPSDLLDGIAEFRPHVAHYSGHSNEPFVVFEHNRDAIRYSARLYGAITNGQSIAGAHELARTELAMQGTDAQDLPTLMVAGGLDARQVSLVTGTA